MEYLNKFLNSLDSNEGGIVGFLKAVLFFVIAWFIFPAIFILPAAWLIGVLIGLQ